MNKLVISFLSGTSLVCTMFASQLATAKEKPEIAKTKNQPAKQLPVINWDSRIEQEHLSSTLFTEIMAKAIASAVPKIKIRNVRDLELFVEFPDKTKSTIFLRNAWIATRDDTEERKEILRRYVKGVIELPFQQVAISKIVPLLRTNDYFKVPAGPAERLGLDGKSLDVYSQPFVGEIRLVYGVDKPQSIGFLSRKEFQKLGMSSDKLKAEAMKNLKAALWRKPEIRLRDGYGIVLAGGDYESSLLLDNDLWSHIEKSIRGPILAAIPARDILIFADAGNASAVNNLKRGCEIGIKGDHAISKQILKRVNGHWELY